MIKNKIQGYLEYFFNALLLIPIFYSLFAAVFFKESSDNIFYIALYNMVFYNIITGFLFFIFICLFVYSFVFKTFYILSGVFLTLIFLAYLPNGGLRKSGAMIESSNTYPIEYVTAIASILLFTVIIWFIEKKNRIYSQQIKIEKSKLENAENKTLSEIQSINMQGLISENLNLRLDAIQNLNSLKNKKLSPDVYEKSMHVLCAFIRNPTKDTALEKKYNAKGLCRPDVEETLKLIGKRSESQLEYDIEHKIKYDLSFVNLKGVKIGGANFQNFNLSYSDWNSPETHCLLTDFRGAICIGANFEKADCFGARFQGADCSDMIKSKSTHFTQKKASQTTASKESEKEKTTE